MLYKINVTQQMEGMECLEKEQRSTEGCEWLAWQVAELQHQASRDNDDAGGHLFYALLISEPIRSHIAISSLAKRGIVGGGRGGCEGFRVERLQPGGEWGVRISYAPHVHFFRQLSLEASQLLPIFFERMLCHLCSQLDRYAYLNGSDEYHSLPDYNLGHLETSSAECDLCHLLISKARLYPQVHEHEIHLSVTSGKALWLATNGPGSLIHGDMFPLCTPPCLTGNGQFSVNQGAYCEGRLAFVNSSAPACLDLAKSWLQECLTSHERCNKIKVTDLPARFLEVSTPGGPMSIRVVPSDGIEASYIALSHTWGGDQPLTTTLATLEARTDHISFWELPATFRDAVTIMRWLDCRYLWIDSLCIIQDSEEDWQRESAKMRHVYRGSLITLSALSSLNSESGILGPRTPKTAVEIAPTKSALYGSVFVTAKSESWNELLGRTVLNTRGWTLQERLLPPRLLHFSDEEILWECLTCVQRETSRAKIAKLFETSYEKHYTGPVIDVNMPPVDYSEHKDILNSIDEWRGNESKDPYLTWHKAVSYFSGRKLSFRKDRLPAISGLAAEMSLLTGDTYLAGVWEADLLNGLSWRLHPGADASSVLRPLIYRAPSWPWASIDGKIEYFSPPKGITRQETAHTMGSGTYLSSSLDGSMAPEILGKVVQPLGLDPLGEVTSGSISMICSGLPVVTTPDPESSGLQKDHKVLVIVEQHSSAWHNFPTVPWPFDHKREVFEGIIDSINDLHIPTCICIPIARRRVDFVDNVIALLVVPAPGETEIFRRIGISWLREEKATRLFGSRGKMKITLI